jgi:two-component sensor histidine kinase
VEPVEIDVEKAVPLSLIASELVLNSLKHAFRTRKEGSLTVRLGYADGTCRLFIGDDGPGMQPPDPARGGIGLQLIDGLTKQIKGRREISAGPGVGNTIIWDQ